MKIVTLTLNPAFDVHCSCDNFKPYHESIAKVTAKDAGGKGVNISRALCKNGVENLAVVIVGKENGVEFCQALEKDGLSVAAVWTDGRIRENITLHEKENPETRISFDGFTCDKSILTRVREEIGDVDENTIVAFTGSIPKGINSTTVLAFLKELKAKNAKIVIDSRSVSFDELISFKPWLIKPNKDEAEAYAERKIECMDDAIIVAREFYKNGIDNVMISLGEDGAVLACENGLLTAKTPKISVLSTIGAGDSMLAGFIDGVAKGLEKKEILKRAVAFGTAACMQDGTKPPQKVDIENLISKVIVREIRRGKEKKDKQNN